MDTAAWRFSSSPATATTATAGMMAPGYSVVVAMVRVAVEPVLVRVAVEPLLVRVAVEPVVVRVAVE